MSRRTWLALLVAIATLGIAAPADARPKGATAAQIKKEKAAAKKKALAKKKKLAARKKAAARKRAAARKQASATQVASGSNMPHGWTWPPSSAMDENGKACTDELDLLGIAWKPAAAQQKIATPITLDVLELAGIKLVSTYRKGPHVMDCHLALGLATHGVQLYALGVREIHFSRIYDYTQVRAHGVTKNALSRHALGLAMDMRAFVDDTGHKAVVVDDYLKGDPLLLRVEDYLNDSGGFRTVLTPRNDPESHYDHFHVEVSVDYDLPAPARPGS